jgi:cell cycle related kinase
MIDPQYVYNLYDVDSSSKYTPGQILGEGAFGKVRLGIDKSTGGKVAMKYVKVISRERIIPKAVFREIEALRQLSDSNKSIVKLYDVFAHETDICLVMEYVESDLSVVISTATSQIPTRWIKAYLYMTLEAVAYCHSKSLVHRDLKPSNVLINSLGQIKLGDFGLARTLKEPVSAGSDEVLPQAAVQREALSHQIATRWYRAPELLFAARHYDYSVDVWALGAILGELFCLQPLFPGTSDIDQIYRVLSVMGSPSETRWPDAFELPDYKKIIFPAMEPLDFRMLFPHLAEADLTFLHRLLQLDPKLRVSAANVSVHCCR